ncbi:MAG: hypothetical protein ABJB34_00215 [Acidobacteriota bacterium]
MAWIKTIGFDEADEKLRTMLSDLRGRYPREYRTSIAEQTGIEESILESHTLIPDAMYHAFASYAAMLSPDLPLERRQHEMIATMVSVANDCFY